MTKTKSIDHHTALIYVMVLAAAVDGDMSDQEMLTIGNMVDRLPVFDGFDKKKLAPAAEGCVEYLNGEESLDKMLAIIQFALSPQLLDTAYAVACEIVACDTNASQEELRFLELVRHKLDVDRLTAAGIERGIAALNRTL